MRLLGTLFFILPFPLLSFVYAMYGFIKSPRNWRKALPFYIYAIFMLAYCYELPTGTNVDLIRYYAQLDNLQGRSLSQVITLMADDLYMENVLFWLIAQLNMPHLLPAITTATVYGIAAYIACDYAEVEDRPFIWRVIVMQLVMIPFFSVAVNIRNVFAFSLIGLASYLDLHRKKRNLWVLLLYILPVFMHKTGIIILILRLLVPLFKRLFALAMAIVVALPVLIQFVYSRINTIAFGGAIGNLLRTLIRSSYLYLLGESSYAERVRNSLGAAVTRYVVFFYLIVVLLYYIVGHIRKVRLSDFNLMGYLLCILSLSCNAIDTPAYWRFAAGLCVVNAPIMYAFYRGKLFSRSLTAVIRYGMILYYIARFALAAARSVSMDFDATAVQILTNNVYTLLITLLGRIFVL